jgi:hypothetical protein
MTRNYDYADDYAEDQVVNVSGGDWQGSQVAPRPGHQGGYVSPRTLPHRTQFVINAESGQRLDTGIERALSQAAGKLSIEETVDSSHPWARPMLRHIFGLNLPGRDREV